MEQLHFFSFLEEPQVDKSHYNKLLFKLQNISISKYVYQNKK